MSALKYSLLFCSAALLAAAVWFSCYLNNREEKQILYFGGNKIVAGVARTAQEKTKGLSGIKSLGAGRGLLFLMDSERGCIWMKDMHFSIDILWFDAEYRLVDMKNNVSPETYPKNFCPSEEAKYILELPAGFPDATRADIGQKLIVR